MKILHVIDSMGPGGAERNLVNLFGPLQALGVENSLVTLWPGNAFRDRVEQHVAHVEEGIWRGNPASGLTTLVRLARCVDVIHTHLVWADIFGRTAGALTRKPVFSTLHSTWYARQNVARLPSRVRRQVQVVRHLDKLTGRVVRHYFAVSEAVRDCYVRELGLPAGRISIVPNAIDLTEFSGRGGVERTGVRRRIGISQEESMILVVARLAEQKDHASAIRAAAELAATHPVHLCLVGVGPLDHELRALASRISAPVSFLGQRDDVPELLAAADVFLLPTFFEGMSVALMEALATGLPCVCSDIPENREVAGDAAEYAEPGNPGALVQTLGRVITDPVLRETLRVRGQAKASRFDARRVAAGLVSSIESAL